MSTFISFQKSDLKVAEAKAVINGAVDSSGESGAAGDSSVLQATVQRLTEELEEAKKKTHQKDEEVKLYRGKLDENTKQMTLLVSTVTILLWPQLVLPIL